MKSADDFAIEYFRRAVANGRLGHAYLIGGVTSAQAVALGTRIARVLLCPEVGCGRCATCTSIEDGTSPDLHVLQPPQDGRVIQVEEIRRFVIHEASLKTYGGGRKVFLIIDADAMNESAANCFLKTLEEPPGGSMMLLMSGRPGNLPATIASRCFRLSISRKEGASDRLVDQEAAERIIERLAAGPFEDHLEIADEIIAACQGESSDERRRAALELLDAVMMACRNGMLGAGPLAGWDPYQIEDRVSFAADAQERIDANGNLSLVIDDFAARFMGVGLPTQRITVCRT